MSLGASPLDSQVQPVNPKGNQPWVFTGRTDAWSWNSNTLATWCKEHQERPHIGKDPDAGKDWRQEEKGTIEDEVVGWHHWLNGHEFEQTLGDGKGQEIWRAAVHGVAKIQTWFSNWTTTFTLLQCLLPIFSLDWFLNCWILGVLYVIV